MDDYLIAPWERLAASRAEMAAAEGISVRTLQRRLAAARERVANGPGIDEWPLVALVDHEWPRRHHYDTDTQHHGVGGDRLEGPGGLFRIGRHFGRGAQVQHASNGAPVDSAQGQEAPSEGRCVSESDRAHGVVFVQPKK